MFGIPSFVECDANSSPSRDPNKVDVGEVLRSPGPAASTSRTFASLVLSLASILDCSIDVCQ